MIIEILTLRIGCIPLFNERFPSMSQYAIEKKGLCCKNGRLVFDDGRPTSFLIFAGRPAVIKSSPFKWRVRHEALSTTVKFNFMDLHLLFHQWFPTGTCWIGNDLVRSCRNNVAPSS
jgi:hypothetical protein